MEMKFKEGETVKIIARHWGHHFAIGEIVRITGVDDIDGDYTCKSSDGAVWFCHEDEIKSADVCEQIINDVRKYGLETAINERIQSEAVKELIRALFQEATDSLSDEDYQELTNRVIENYKNRYSD